MASSKTLKYSFLEPSKGICTNVVSHTKGILRLLFSAIATAFVNNLIKIKSRQQTETEAFYAQQMHHVVDCDWFTSDYLQIKINDFNNKIVNFSMKKGYGIHLCMHLKAADRIQKQQHIN